MGEEKDDAEIFRRDFWGVKNLVIWKNTGNMVILAFSMFVCQKMNRLNSGGESEQKRGITEN